MYHWIMKRTCQWAFRELSRQNKDALMAYISPNIYHHFAGNHALGGERYGKAAFSAWLNRLFTLFPELTFHIYTIAVTGLPGNTKALISWKDQGYAIDGEPYENHGAHILTFKWGTLTSLQARLDTKLLVDHLDRMAANGYPLAHAKPLTHA